MDAFDRTFLPAAIDAGLDMPTISRHLPVVRRCLGTEPVLLVTRGTRADRPHAGEHLVVLTRTRLVITHESRLVHRLRLHLDAPLHELSQVRWAADAHQCSVELSATAIDGIRERFVLKVRQPDAVWHVEETLGYLFAGADESLAAA
jgi:hypothetical protein